MQNTGMPNANADAAIESESMGVFRKNLSDELASTDSSTHGTLFHGIAYSLAMLVVWVIALGCIGVVIDTRHWPRLAIETYLVGGYLLQIAGCFGMGMIVGLKSPNHARAAAGGVFAVFAVLEEWMFCNALSLFNASGHARQNNFRTFNESIGFIAPLLMAIAAVYGADLARHRITNHANR